MPKKRSRLRNGKMQTNNEKDEINEKNEKNENEHKVQERVSSSEEDWNASNSSESESDTDVHTSPINTPIRSRSKKVKAQTCESKKTQYRTPLKTQSTKLSFSTGKKKKANSNLGAPALAEVPAKAGVLGMGCHLHDRFEWLNETRKDKNGNGKDSEEFDSKTLLVPSGFLKKETPAMMQWWAFKKDNMDLVLFFKVGKFYELFHMDADIGFKVLNLIYMKGEKAHSGFPETAYGKMAWSLSQHGYRVARIEQTETPAMLKERNGKAKLNRQVTSKVVERELCSVVSKGTNTQSFMFAKQAKNVASRYLLALNEYKQSDDVFVYAICLVDCTTGYFRVGHFNDTLQRTELRTLLSRYQVTEMIYNKDRIESDTKRILQHATTEGETPIMNGLRNDTEFPKAENAVQALTTSDYFDELPPVLQELVNDYASNSIDSNPSGITLAAIGACIWLLKRSLIDHELISKKLFTKAFVPKESNGETHPGIAELGTNAIMHLDAHSIRNLELLENTWNGSTAGTLIALMDRTVTPFGKREFRNWLLKPLYNAQNINERYDAVECLIVHQDLRERLLKGMKDLPDLERLVAKIHSIGSYFKKKDHPDIRAIMYESVSYNKRKIDDFSSCLQGFKAASTLMETIGKDDLNLSSTLLNSLLTIENEQDSNCVAKFPRLNKALDHFHSSFDIAKAKSSGIIAPYPGVDEEYDASCENLSAIEAELGVYLKEQKRNLSNSSISYWGSKKEERYQLEVPESCKVPSEYELKTKKKGWKRYHTPTIRKLLERLITAEELKEELCKNQMRKLFYSFSEHAVLWARAIQCLSNLDCILSLAGLAVAGGGEYIRPSILDSKDSATLNIQCGVHPSLATTVAGDNFIPNDMVLGTDKFPALMTLLSGPNMGGKSTLLRQTCLIVLMAQMGSFVPASLCEFSLVDRIFTRLGASDKIMEGQSTFYVELAETSAILNSATENSLVILDELGRGTSTFDGTAIAYAVVEELTRQIKCRTMFATHYHSLVEEYIYDDSVSLAHMQCVVHDDAEQKVTFLYKLVKGMCPKSYGINVARLAGLQKPVLDMAAAKSLEFESNLLAISDENTLKAQSTMKTLANLLEHIHEGDNYSKVYQIWQDLNSKYGKE